MRDVMIGAFGTGLVASVFGGTVLVRALDRVPRRWRRPAEWSFIVATAVVTILGDLWWSSKGNAAEAVFVFLLASLPGLLAYLVWRTRAASALLALLPFYFVIGSFAPARRVHAPAMALDRAIPLQAGWIFVYGSLFAFVLLPVLVVRQRPLFRRTLLAYLAVMIAGYLGFLLYPTVTPRPTMIAGDGFAAWWLRLTYSLDSRYNCFPCLHVAYSFVSALACYRVSRRVGTVAAIWAALTGISTLYTKQHYVVDVAAGTLMAFAAYAVLLRPYPRDAVAEIDRRRAPLRALGVAGVYAALVAGAWILHQVRLV